MARSADPVSSPAQIMTRSGPSTFVGFGFGPIQTGLFLYEAFRAGRFERLVVAEVVPEAVRAVRAAGGRYSLNIARPDSIDRVEVGPVELHDPASPDGRQALVEAIATASEVATAVPSVRFYATEAPGSIHRLLARGLEHRQGRPTIVYAAENHHHAADVLKDLVVGEVSPRERDRVVGSTEFLDTVIGKMSGVISGPEDRRARGLAPLTPSWEVAHLVEEFCRILVSRPRSAEGRSIQRGLSVFEEKEDLLPFEEAKLHGHNAAHALAAYLARRRGLTHMHQIPEAPGLAEIVRAAFLEESGAALIRRHAGVDRLFTPEGYREYVDDLMARMLNPNLGDLVDRVARDPERKLGWNDRLVGTMRLVLREGIEPRRFALGAAAALCHLEPRVAADPNAAAGRLRAIWEADAPQPDMAQAVLDRVATGLEELSSLPGA